MRDAREWWQRGSSSPPAIEEQGQGGQGCKSVLFMVSTKRHFFKLSSYILFLSEGLPPSIQRNSLSATKCNNFWKQMLWKVTHKLKFWCHYDIIISASAFLQPSVPTCPTNSLMSLKLIFLYCQHMQSVLNCLQ